MALKCKNVMFVQQLDYLPSNNLQDILTEFDDKLHPKHFAGIIHNKDQTEDGEPVAPHVHIVLQFENARSLTSLSKIVNQPVQCFEQWKGSINNAYSYLVHHTKNVSTKHTYNPKEVVSNFDYIARLESIEKSVTKRSGVNDTLVIQNALDLLYEGAITKEEVERQLTGSQYGKAKQRIEAVHLKYLERKAKEWQKEMREKDEPVTIMWLFGKSGTGKTRLAKRYASQYSEEYFLTGSSRDPFQQYNMEHVIILDELRPHMFDYPDLLKMFDPYNDCVMAGSRYFDKPLMANVYIVTSPYNPYEFFHNLSKQSNVHVNREVDSHVQLMRRLNLVLEITEEHIQFYFYEHSATHFLPDPNQKIPNPFYEESKTRHSEIEAERVKLFKQLTERGRSNEE